MGQAQGGGTSGAGLGTGSGSDQQGPEAPVGTRGQGSAAPVRSEGEYEKIFAPRLAGTDGQSSVVKGERGSGPETVLETGNLPVSPGLLRPYNEVIADYEQEARQTLDRTPVPPVLKEMVRSYFSSLEPDLEP